MTDVALQNRDNAVVVGNENDKGEDEKKEKMKVYWIWAPNDSTLIGITSDYRLISTANYVTKDDIMTTFILPPSVKHKYVFQQDLDEFSKKNVSERGLIIKPGKLPREFVDETFEHIDEYYETVKNYTPSEELMKVVKKYEQNIHIPPNKEALPPHGKHFIVTPPVIQAKEKSVVQLLEKLGRLQEAVRNAGINFERVNELYDVMTGAGLTTVEMKMNSDVEPVTFFFDFGGLRWQIDIRRFHDELKIERKLTTLGFSPRNEIDVLLFYKKMRSGELRKVLTRGYTEETVKEFMESITVRFDPTIFESMNVLQVEKYIQRLAAHIKKNIKEYFDIVYQCLAKLADLWRVFDEQNDFSFIE